MSLVSNILSSHSFYSIKKRFVMFIYMTTLQERNPIKYLFQYCIVFHRYFTFLSKNTANNHRVGIKAIKTFPLMLWKIYKSFSCVYGITITLVVPVNYFVIEFLTLMSSITQHDGTALYFFFGCFYSGSAVCKFKKLNWLFELV